MQLANEYNGRETRPGGARHPLKGRMEYYGEEDPESVVK